MALQPQQVMLPILGLDTHSAPENAPAGSLRECTNYYMQRLANGGAELRKRFGTTSLTQSILGGGSISVGKKLGVFKDQRLLMTDAQLYSYSPDQVKWQAKGAVTTLGITAEKLTGRMRDKTLADMAISGNLLCSAHVDVIAGPNNGVRVTVVDLNTGTTLLQADSTLGFAINPSNVKVVALSSSFLIFSTAAAAGTVEVAKIAFATPTTVSAVTSLVFDSAGNSMDVIRNGSADSALVAYTTTTVGAEMKVFICDSSMAVGASAARSETADRCLGFIHWDQSDNKAYLASGSGTTGVKIQEVNLPGVTFGGVTTADGALTTCRNVSGYRSGSTNFLFIEIAGSSTYNNLIRKYSGTPGTTAVWQRALGMTSRVFKVGSIYYLVANYDDSFQDSYYVLDASSGSAPIIVGKALYGLGGGEQSLGMVTSVPAFSSTVAMLPVRRYSFNDGSDKHDIYTLRLDFAATTSRMIRGGNNLHIPGANVRVYDGEAVSECGHHLAPIITLAQSAGGALTATGTFSFIAHYTWIDAAGQIHTSQVSEPATITLTGANQTIQVTVTQSRVSEHPLIASTANMFIEIFMTESGGSIYYHIASQLGNPTTDTSGSTRATNPDTTARQLYTTGGVLSHSPMPSARFIEIVNNRMFLAGTENPLELWPSNELVPGEGVSFSDQTVLTLEADGGDITAIAQRDGRPVIFKRNRIYEVYGAGPTLDGANQYEQPQLVSSELGATTCAGVISTPRGVFFTSTKGRFLLPSGGGAPVKLLGPEAYDTSAVKGAVVVDAYEQVRIFVQEAGGPRALVNHYGIPDETGMGRWTTFSYTSPTWTMVDAIVWNGKVAMLDTGGLVREEHLEGAGFYQDDGVSYAAVAYWNWISPAAMHGDAKIWNIRPAARATNAATVTATLYADFSDTSIQTATLAAGTTTLPAMEIKPARQECTSMALKLSETNALSGVRYTGLALELGVQGRMRHLNTAHRMT